MRLLDANILVYAHRQEDSRQKKIGAWLESEINAGENIALCQMAETAFLRTVTHPSIFLKPSPLAEAFSFLEGLRSQENTRVLAPGRRYWEFFKKLANQAGVRGNNLYDTALAALSMEWGAVCVTTDSGFGRYRGLTWKNPLD